MYDGYPYVKNPRISPHAGSTLTWQSAPVVQPYESRGRGITFNVCVDTTLIVE